VQRWVRACDAAPTAARLRLLDSILRCGQPQPAGQASAAGVEGAGGGGGAGIAPAPFVFGAAAAGAGENQNQHSAARAFASAAEDDAAQRMIEAAGGGACAVDGPAGEAAAVEGGAAGDGIAQRPVWAPTPWQRPEDASGASTERPASGAVAAEQVQVQSRVVRLERGAERQPPNVHALRIHATAPGTVKKRSIAYKDLSRCVLIPDVTPPLLLILQSSLS